MSYSIFVMRPASRPHSYSKSETSARSGMPSSDDADMGCRSGISSHLLSNITDYCNSSIESSSRHLTLVLSWALYIQLQGQFLFQRNPQCHQVFDYSDHCQTLMQTLVLGKMLPLEGCNPSKFIIPSSSEL